MLPRVKICCISSPEEALTAIAHGADAIGLVGHMPSGPGIISDDLINEITSVVPPPIGTFLLTSETDAINIVSHHRKTYTNTLQLVDYLEDTVYYELRNQLPYVRLVQVIHVIDEDDIERARRITPWVHALLLDSGNPNLATKVLGGTGNVHDWRISKQIRDSVSIPVFLAGGINASNAKKAISEVSPFGLDLCSSVRTNGRLDALKLKAFFEAIQV